MGKGTRYTDAPRPIATALKESRVVEDFLPPPEELIRKETQIKVTINLSKRSVEFFKRAAARHGVPYQAMIKSLLDRYTDKYGKTT